VSSSVPTSNSSLMASIRTAFHPAHTALVEARRALFSVAPALVGQGLDRATARTNRSSHWRPAAWPVPVRQRVAPGPVPALNLALDQFRSARLLT